MLATVLALILPALADDPQTAATVWLRAGGRSAGTGWVVDREKRWIITAQHVVGDRDTVEVFFRGPLSHRPDVLAHRSDLIKLRRLTTARVVRRDVMRDLALLVAEQLPPDVPALKLAPTITAGEQCSMIGHRQDADQLWLRTMGVVRQVGRSSEGYFWSGRQIGIDVEVMLAQLPAELGESGSAICNARGEVVGLLSAISLRTAGLAIAISSRELTTFLERSLPKNRHTDDKLSFATLLVRPSATDGRHAGVVIDRERRLVLTTSTAAGSEDMVDVIFPRRVDGRLVAEAGAYRDSIGLILSGHQVRAIVLARDRTRDLALLQLPASPVELTALPVAGETPRDGSTVSAVSHPSGIELSWLRSSGIVRGRGRAVLSRDEGTDALRSEVLLLQLPSSGSSSGGPIVNGHGEVVAIASAREGSRQELVYAASTAEVQSFLKDARAKHTPTDVHEWMARANYFADRSQANEAIVALDRAIALAPKGPLPLAMLARVAAEAGMVDRARVAIAQLPAERPTDCEVELALAYWALGSTNEAIASARRLLAKEPNNRVAKLVLASLAEKAEALTQLNAWIDEGPPTARAFRARARFQAVDDAIDDLGRAIELARFDTGLRVERAKLLATKSEWKKAARDYSRALEESPRDGRWRAALAEAQLRAGEDAAGMDSIVAIWRIHGKRPAITAIRLHARFLLDDDRNDPRRANEWYRKTIEKLIPWAEPTDRETLNLALKEKQATPAADQQWLDQILSKVEK